jgi:hypothetical protein
MADPKCVKCGRIHCQIADLPHDASTPQIHPGFEHLKPVDFKQVLATSMKGVEVVKARPPKGPRRPKGKTYKQENSPKGDPGTLIGGGDVRMTAKEKHARVRLLGGDPSKIFVKGELPKGGPLMPYEGLGSTDVHGGGN